MALVLFEAVEMLWTLWARSITLERSESLIVCMQRSDQGSKRISFNQVKTPKKLELLLVRNKLVDAFALYLKPFCAVTNESIAEDSPK